MAFSKITYNGKEILFFDHKGLSGPDLLNSIKEATKVVIEHPSNEILYIADFTDTVASIEVMDFLKSDENKKAAAKTKKSAVIGISGVKKFLLNTYNMFFNVDVKACNELEEAKKYVVS
jgi:hypothetical protein